METKKERTPIIAAQFTVDVLEWDNEFWKGKKMVRVRIDPMDDTKQDILLWPCEANTLMDMLKENLRGLDLSYDTEKSWEDSPLNKDWIEPSKRK